MSHSQLPKCLWGLVDKNNLILAICKFDVDENNSEFILTKLIRLLKIWGFAEHETHALWIETLFISSNEVIAIELKYNLALKRLTTVLIKVWFMYMWQSRFYAYFNMTYTWISMYVCMYVFDSLYAWE